MIFVLVYFQALKRKPVRCLTNDACPISWLVKCRKYNHLIGYNSNSNFKFKFSNVQIQNKLLCLSVFVAKRIFKTYQRFCFLCFILVDAFSGSIKTEKSQKEEKRRKLSCTRLNFGEILFAGTKRAVPSGQYRSILPARVANQNTESAAYCPLAELAI